MAKMPAPVVNRAFVADLRKVLQPHQLAMGGEQGRVVTIFFELGPKTMFYYVLLCFNYILLHFFGIPVDLMGVIKGAVRKHRYCLLCRPSGEKVVISSAGPTRKPRFTTFTTFLLCLLLSVYYVLLPF